MIICKKSSNPLVHRIASVSLHNYDITMISIFDSKIHQMKRFILFHFINHRILNLKLVTGAISLALLIQLLWTFNPSFMEILIYKIGLGIQQ